jgi:hypothetical protein
MVVDRRITGTPTADLDVESVTVETPNLDIEGNDRRRRSYN